MAGYTVKMLFSEGLEYLYGAHRQGAAQAAANERTSISPKLRAMLRAGARANLDQACRLESVFRSAGLPPRARHDRAMQGIIDANNARIAATRDPAARDLINIELGQVAAHFYLATYGTLRAHAEQLGNGTAVRLLQRTLDETGLIDREFTRLARRLAGQSGAGGYGGEAALRTTIAMHPGAMHPGMLVAAVTGLLAAGIALVGRSDRIARAPARPVGGYGQLPPGPVDEAAAAGLSL